jgi:hypothetical protein
MNALPVVSPRLLYCHCAYAAVVPKAVKEEVLRGLVDSGVPFDAVPDLCELSAKKDPCLADLTSDEPTKLVACYPRAVKWLFHAAGVELSQNIEVINMRTDTAESILNNVLGTTSPEAKV